MANKSISQLNNLTPVGGMFVPMEDAGNTGKATIDEIVAASSSAQDHETRISSTESGIVNMTSRVGDLETTTSSLSTTVSTLSDSVGANTWDIASIESDVSDLDGSITALSSLYSANIGTHKIMSGRITASTPLSFAATYAIGVFWFNDSNSYLAAFRSGDITKLISNGSTVTFEVDETTYTVSNSSTNFDIRYIIVYKP